MKGEKKREKQKELQPFLHRWLLQIDGWLRRMATRLQANTSRYSPQRLKGALIGFCLLLACLSSYIIIESIEGKFSSFSVTPIHAMPLPKSLHGEPAMGGGELGRIHNYKRYLDSLSWVQGRKAFLDSFSALHPRLMDTLIYLENIYQQQLKTKTYEK